MLELPESTIIAKEIEEHLVGKIIRSIEVLHNPHRFAFFKGDTNCYEEYLVGKQIVGATNYGGLVQIDLQDSMIAFGDGAYPRYYADEKKYPKKHQFAVCFEDETAIFVSIQMYGEIFVFPQGQCAEEYYLSSVTKPNPLTQEFTLDYFMGLYPQGAKPWSVKKFLATEQRIPGLGNGVLQDILWDAGMDPRYLLKKEDMKSLYDSIKKILGKMIADGGRDTEKTLLGEKGGYITQLSKNSLHEPCTRCGTPIHKANYMGGTIYFCEHCQRLD